VATARFDWSALPAAVRQHLTGDLGLAGDDTARALARRFGAVPTEAFVKAAWATLRDRWIAKDPVLRRSVVSALRARGLGTTSITGNGARAQVDYLCTCRSSPALRAIVLDHLLAIGSAPVPAPVPAPASAPAPAIAPIPATHAADHFVVPDTPLGPDELREQVRRVLAQVLGTDDVRTDTEGDFPIPTQQSVAFVRVLPDAPIVRVFSPILWGFGAPADIQETVNDINRRTNWVKAVWEHGAVVLLSDVVGKPLAESQLAAAVQSVVRRADELGPVLQEKYGGTTAFGTPRPARQPPPIGGYL